MSPSLLFNEIVILLGGGAGVSEIGTFGWGRLGCGLSRLGCSCGVDPLLEDPLVSGFELEPAL